MKTNRFACLAAALLLAVAIPVMGQAQGGGGNGGGGGQQQGGGGGGGGGGNGGGQGGGRGNFDPAAMQQRMLDRIKTQLGASDDEFAALQPKIVNVMQLSRDANGGMRGMFGAGGRRRGGNNETAGGNNTPTTQPSAVQAALSDLQTTLQDQNASPDTIKDKLQTLRDSRAAAKQQLAAAQADLKSLLTQRQEAQLVLMGLLE